MDVNRYDVAIVGGGIIGLSTAMQLKADRRPGWRVAVVEKEPELAGHQTAHNSGVIHSGIYYYPDSYKARLCSTGAHALLNFCDENGIEYEQCGKVIVATTQPEVGLLHNIYEWGVANEMQGLEMIGPERLSELEPHVTGLRALRVSGTSIVDFRKVASAYATKFKQAGGDVHTGASVTRIASTPEGLVLETTKGPIHAKHLINCAGLYADRVARMMGDKIGVQIVPFRAQNYTLRPQSSHLVSGIVYPVAGTGHLFKGVHFTRSIHGYVEAGHKVALALKREGYRTAAVDLKDGWESLSYPGFWRMAARNWKTAVSESTRARSKRVFVRGLQRLIPEIRHTDLASGEVGVRAQAVSKDGTLLENFSIIRNRQAVHFLDAAGPGATSSLAIGRHIVDLATEAFGSG